MGPSVPLRVEGLGVSPGGQGLELLRFAGVGIQLAILYDLFRLWRIAASPPARRVFWQDLLFCALAALFTQLMALPISRGRIRLFHLAAIALGGILYLQTAGRLTLRLFRLIRRGWDRLCGNLRRWIPPIRRRGRKMGEKAKKTIKNVWKNAKKHLHLPHKI